MNNIKTLTAQIQERDDAIAAEKSQENAILTNLGRAVFDSGQAAEIPEEIVQAADRATEEIRKLEYSLRGLLSDEERRAAIGEERKLLNVELRNIKNKEVAIFEELGKAAWELWKSGRHVEGLQEALVEPIKAEERLHAAEDAVFRNESTWGSTGSVFSRGRAIFLAGRRKSASAARDRLWAKAGTGVMELVDREELKDTPAAGSAATLAALNERRDEIDVQLESLTEEHRNLDAALEEMPGKGSARKRALLTERLLDDARSNLDRAYRELGQSWMETEQSNLPPEVEKQKKELDDLISRIAGLEGEKHDLEAHRTILEIEVKWKEQAAMVESLNAVIKTRQADLKNAKKTLFAIEKELAELKEKLPPLPEN